MAHRLQGDEAHEPTKCRVGECDGVPSVFRKAATQLHGSQNAISVRIDCVEAFGCLGGYVYRRHTLPHRLPLCALFKKGFDFSHCREHFCLSFEHEMHRVLVLVQGARDKHQPIYNWFAQKNADHAGNYEHHVPDHAHFCLGDVRENQGHAITANLG